AFGVVPPVKPRLRRGDEVVVFLQLCTELLPCKCVDTAGADQYGNRNAAVTKADPQSLGVVQGDEEGSLVPFLWAAIPVVSYFVNFHCSEAGRQIARNPTVCNSNGAMKYYFKFSYSHFFLSFRAVFVCCSTLGGLRARLLVSPGKTDCNICSCCASLLTANSITALLLIPKCLARPSISVSPSSDGRQLICFSLGVI